MKVSPTAVIVYPSPHFASECEVAIRMHREFAIRVPRASSKIQAVRRAVVELRGEMSRTGQLLSIFDKSRTLDFWDGIAGAVTGGWKFSYELDGELVVHCVPSDLKN